MLLYCFPVVVASVQLNTQAELGFLNFGGGGGQLLGNIAGGGNQLLGNVLGAALGVPQQQPAAAAPAAAVGVSWLVDDYAG